MRTVENMSIGKLSQKPDILVNFEIPTTSLVKKKEKDSTVVLSDSSYHAFAKQNYAQIYTWNGPWYISTSLFDTWVCLRVQTVWKCKCDPFGCVGGVLLCCHSWFIKTSWLFQGTAGQESEPATLC